VVAVFGAIVLSGAIGQASVDVVGHVVAGHVVAGHVVASHVLGATSTRPFAIVFLAAAGTLTIAFLALLLVEEKPLQATMPSAQPQKSA
jgi:hypothetical protein